MLVHRASSLSFYFTTTPTQCGQLGVYLTGTGKPPYTLLLVDNNDTSSGKWTMVQFSTRAYTFTLDWPSGSEFVAMLSDSTGIGSGGTSLPTYVQPSNDESCGPREIPHSVFEWNYQGDLRSCQNVNITTTTTTLTAIRPPITGWVIFPGGQSFATPEFNGPDVSSFLWNVNVRPGARLIVAFGDQNGPLSGQVNSPRRVLDGADTSCLNFALSPQETPNPAGQVRIGPSASSSDVITVTGTEGTTASIQDSKATTLSGVTTAPQDHHLVVVEAVSAVAGLLLCLFAGATFLWIRARRRAVASQATGSILVSHDRTILPYPPLDPTSGTTTNADTSSGTSTPSKYERQRSSQPLQHEEDLCGVPDTGETVRPPPYLA